MTTTGALPLISWGESVARHLLDATSCPVCGFAGLEAGCCPRCGADLRGPLAMEVWNASASAAAALRSREELLARLPLGVPGAPAPVPSPAAVDVTGPAEASVAAAVEVAAAPEPGAVAPTVPQEAGAAQGLPVPPLDPPGAVPPPPSSGLPSAPGDPQGSATLQSVLATAGAGLFAVAAIVFTYFNPDLADRALRSVIVGLITLLFLGGAWMLSRRGLRFSAEAVGGLGLVFAGLDIHAVAQLAAPEIDPWFTAAGVTAVAGTVMLVAGESRGIRVWSWTAQIALALVPGMIGWGVGTPLAAAVGVIGIAYAGAGLVEWLRPERFGRISLTAVQLVASLTALVLIWRVGDGDAPAFLWTLSGMLLLIAVHAVIAARRLLAPLWAYGAGGAGASAVVVAVYALMMSGVRDSSWMFAIIPAGAALALVLVGVLAPLPRRVPRGFVAGGALTVLAGPSLILLGMSGLIGVSTLSGFLSGSGAVAPGVQGWATVLGLSAVCAGLSVFAAVARWRGGVDALAIAAARLSLVAGALAVLVLGCAGVLPQAAAVAVLTGMAVLVAGGVRVRPGLFAARGVPTLVLLSAHLFVVAAVVVSWRDQATAPLTGIAALLALAALAAVRPPSIRFAYVGAGFGYALVLTATALGQVGVGGIAQLCLTASAGLAVAIAVTYLPRVGARDWQAVLVVSAVPFAIGVLQVVVERSGWTALSTGLMFALAMSLLLTRRPGLTIVVRTAAAAMLVPTLAVVVVCLGAQLLVSSASPVTLPVIAVLVALVLPSTGLVRGALLARGHGVATAGAARVAIEASALLTGAIATGLALAREAAGLGTTFLVLLILGVGAAATAVFTGRRYGWPVAGAAFTGALWCVWGLAGVDLLEAYLLPPTLGAALVAVILTLRGRRAAGLYAAGLGIAIAPLLAIIAVVEPDGAGQTAVTWRVAGLLAAAWGLLALSALFGRSAAGSRMRRLRALRIPTALAAGLAAVAGTVQGVRIGLGWDLPSLHGGALLLACLGVSALGAAAMQLAGRSIRSAAAEGSRVRTGRWLGAPAALALAAGTWCAIERDWFSIWAMWGLMAGYLIAVVAVALRLRRGATVLPPVWFLFAIAFATAVVAWSPRDLRVEWFSLPLGAFLLVAGAIGMRMPAGAAPTLNSWPGRWSGSWALLGPGLATMLSASIVSTFTDPLTWRAILVMVLALAAILVGSRGRLAAPFLIGLIVLPIENVFVFSVQIGRGVESMPWWITLAVMGAVLLIIAVTAERRTGESGSVAARIRDLR